MTTPPAERPLIASRWRFDGFEALDACHRETMRMLKQLDALVRRVDEVGDDARTRAMAAEINRHFSITTREHHEDEERHVFPALADGGDAATRHAVECLRQDHFWMDADWRELSPLVGAIAHGVAGGDIETLRQGAEVFAQLCHDHITLEESLIYPKVAAAMSETQRDAMNREMASRRRRERPYAVPD